MLQIARDKRKLLTGLHRHKPQITKGTIVSFMLLIAGFVSGCANFLLGENAMSRNPIENPTQNITNFSRSLDCMDNLLIQHDAPRITITAQDVPNMTGDGNSIAGTKDMLITSISKLSQRSRRIRFVSYGTDLRDIILLHKAHDGRDNFVTPDYFIRGAITQLDKNVMSSRIGAAVNDDSWNAAFSGGQGVSFLGLDLNIGLVSSLQMIPGVTSNNVLALWDRGAGTDLGGRLNSVGTFFDFGIDRRDGIGQAIRNMTDLAVIEVIGKLLDLPYLTCLPLNHSSPAVQSMIQQEYHRFSQNPRKLIRLVQGRLKHFNYYHGPVNGIMDRPTSLALEYFRNLYFAQQPIPGTGALDFNLYYQIMYGQRYAWHFDTLPYARQHSTQQLANHPNTIPDALHYNTARPTATVPITKQHPAHQFNTQRNNNASRAFYPQQNQGSGTRRTWQQHRAVQPNSPKVESTPRQRYEPQQGGRPAIAREAHPSTNAVRPSITAPSINRPERFALPQPSVTQRSHKRHNQQPRSPLANTTTPRRNASSNPPPAQLAQPSQSAGLPISNAVTQTGNLDPGAAREAAFGPPKLAPRQKNWPPSNQRYPYERGDSWERSLSHEVHHFERLYP